MTPDTGPVIRRDGDSWTLVWGQEGIGMGIDRVAERRDELKAEITVESTVAGRVRGPVTLNLLSSQSQSSFAKACSERLNGLSAERWQAIVVQACAVVAKQYREPTPTIDLSTVADTGPPAYLVPGLIPEDETTVIYGDGEGGKSLLVLLIALCVTTGAELPWGGKPRQGNVLVCDWETNPRTYARRLRRLALGMCMPVPQIHYRQCFRSLTDELPNIREEVSRKQIDLVITDSIGFAAAGALVEDETARAAMNAERQMSPATRLVVAHVSAETARATTGVASPFGSRFFWNAMRSGIEVRRSEDQPNSDTLDMGVFHRKANDPDGGKHPAIALRANFDGRAGGILFEEAGIADTPDLAARTSVSSRIRAMLRSGKKTSAEMAEALDVKDATLRTTLARMPDVVRLGEGTGRGHVGVYGLAE